MKALALFAAIVALVHGRPEAGYSYIKPSIPSGIINGYDTYASAGVDSVISGGTLGVNSITGISGNHGISGSSFDGGIGVSAIGGANNVGFTSNSFSSGSSFSGGSSLSGNVGLGVGSIASNGIGGGIFGGGSGTLVQKHIYVHVPPLEHEEIHHQRPISVAPAQKHYKIIFIKAPTPPTPTAPIIPLQPQIEEKTLVYVLVKRPDELQDLHIPTPVPTQPSKPEVYFIRYKAQKEGIGGGDVIADGFLGGRTNIASGIASGGNVGGFISSSVSDAISGGSADGLIGTGAHDAISSSVSSSSSSSQSHSQSSSSSSSISSSYGPPGHNDRY